MSTARIKDYIADITANKEPCIYLGCKVPKDITALVKGLASLLPQPVRLFRLEGDFLRPGEGTRLVDPLMAGETVLLVHTGDCSLPGEFVDLWVDYLEWPQGTSVTVARHLELRPNPNLVTPGFLVVLHIGAIAKMRPRKALRNWIGDDEVMELEIAGRSWGFSITSLGLAALEITIKDLCLLHARDPYGTPRLNLEDTLSNSKAPINWTELQALIRNGDRLLLDNLLEDGRLNEEKWVYGNAALDYLKSQPRAAGVVYSSIYDLVWNCEWAERHEHIFRGQFNIQWRLDSTLHRRKPDGTALDLQTMLDRVQLTETFLAELRKRQLQLFGTLLSDDELLAIAQHYGFFTPLLDYTKSLRVAAFFATLDARKLKPEEECIGVIYHLPVGRDIFISEANDAFARTVGFSTFSLLKEAQISLGRLRLIEPKIPDEDNRIARQKALFLVGYNSRDFQNVSIDRFYFKQQPGEVFEDGAVDITEAILLSDQSPLYKLAQEVKEESKLMENSRIHHLLREVPITESGIIGSDGAWLFAQINEAKRFFRSLQNFARESNQEYILKSLASVFIEYFQTSRTCAVVGELPTGQDNDPFFLDPFSMALSRLAELGGVNEQELWSSIMKHLPSGLGKFWKFESLRGISALAPKTDLERIVLACAFYLVGWEHLRNVNGEKARKLNTIAELVLKRGFKNIGSSEEE